MFSSMIAKCSEVMNFSQPVWNACWWWKAHTIVSLQSLHLKISYHSPQVCCNCFKSIELRPYQGISSLSCYALIQQHYCCRNCAGFQLFGWNFISCWVLLKPYPHEFMHPHFLAVNQYLSEYTTRNPMLWVPSSALTEMQCMHFHNIPIRIA